MISDYSCERCRFSISRLREMVQTGETFYAGEERTVMGVRRVNSRTGVVVFTRPPLNGTSKLNILDLKFIHDLIHDGKIDNDDEQIEAIFPSWGNYISAILHHLGCSTKRFECFAPGR